MELNTKDTGKTIYSMDMESKHGLMVLATKGIIRKARSTVKVPTFGLMAPDMWVIGLTTRSMGKESIPGLMAGHTRGPGRITICMGKGTTAGAMAVNMRVNTTWTRSMGMGSTIGQMAGGTKATGRTVNSTVKASTSCLTESPRSEFGRRANASGGSNKLTPIVAQLTRTLSDYTVT